jgi:hypothetical protein
MILGAAGGSLIALLDQAVAERLEPLQRGREDFGEQAECRPGWQDQAAALGVPDQLHPACGAHARDLGPVGQGRSRGECLALRGGVPPRGGLQPLTQLCDRSHLDRFGRKLEHG